MRSFGLLHTLPKIMRHLLDLLSETDMSHVSHIILSYGDTELVRVSNTGVSLSASHVIHLDVQRITRSLVEANVPSASVTKAKLMRIFRANRRGVKRVVEDMCEKRECEEADRALRTFLIGCTINATFGLIAWLTHKKC